MDSGTVHSIVRGLEKWNVFEVLRKQDLSGATDSAFYGRGHFLVEKEETFQTL
jgi:hypothetical protein